MSDRLNQPWRMSDSRLTYPGRIGYIDERADQILASELSAAAAELRERIDNSISNFGRRYGISEDEARHLLLNTGVRL